MYRKVMEQLEAWRTSEWRKPLILQGARQVGKTYSLLELGRKKYDNVAYFNFETDPSLVDIFVESIAPASLIPSLSVKCGYDILPGRTLVILDEVQLCERALASLKYFCEEAPEYHVVAAGSLLGVAVNRSVFSFPVGKVDMLTMRPMDLEEFMLALGEGVVVGKIKACFESGEPMPKAFHEKALELYREYLVVGGMPECVAQFAQTSDYVLVRHTQDAILAGYLNDMSKYNTNNEIKKTRLAYNSVDVQLSKANKRFQYKLIKSGGRAAEFENAIEWLCLSGIVSRVRRVEQAWKPLENYCDVDAFKIYLSDVGLLSAKKGVVPEDILYPDGAKDDYRGGMTENYVNSQLEASGHKTYYWESERRNAEVDFVIQVGRDIVPIEAKAGDNTKAKSLNAFKAEYGPERSYRLSTKNFAINGGELSVPLYAAFCI